MCIIKNNRSNKIFMENTMQGMKDNKESKGILIAGYILLLIGIFNIIQELYTLWEIVFWQSGGVFTNPLWLQNIQSLLIGGIGIVISSFAIIHRRKWGMYVLATITLSAIVSISIAIIQSSLYIHLSIIGSYPRLFLYNGIQFFALIYLWRHGQELS